MTINLILLFILIRNDVQVISRGTIDIIFMSLNCFLLAFVSLYYLYRRYYGLNWRVEWIVTSVLSDRLKTRQASSQSGKNATRSANGKPRPGTTTKLVDPNFHMDLSKEINMTGVESAMRWSPISRHRTGSPGKSILRQSSRGGSGVTSGFGAMNAGGQKRHSSPPVRWAARFQDSRYVGSRTGSSGMLINNYSDTEINNKLRAWYYRHSYIVKWQAAYRKLHGIIASQAERNNDPELTRNEMRLEQHRKELKQMGINEPLKMFHSRSLKPQVDMRLVSVPKKAKYLDFTEREYNVEHEDYTEATTNLALEWTKTPKEAIRFHTPEHKNRGGSQGNKNANTIKVEKLELGWDDE